MSIRMLVCIGPDVFKISSFLQFNCCLKVYLQVVVEML